MAVELFDKPMTCQKVWDRALSGFIVDSLEERSGNETAEVSDVEKVIGATSDAQWAQVQPVGEGQEYRAEFGQDHASALCIEDHLVHGSVVGV